MKKIFIIFFLFVIVLNTSISAEKWSRYVGYMNLDSANATCKSIGMRLPTIDELKVAYNAGITKSWERHGFGYYWSSTPYDEERYYTLNIGVGTTDYDNRNISLNIRCRR